MSQQGSETPSDAPKNPKLNEGLADDLNAMLQQHSEGSAVVDASPEHAEAVEDLLETREDHAAERQTNQELRVSALQELADEGVLTASHEQLTDKMQEIATREAGESQQSAA